MLGKILKDLRKRNNITQAELANKVGVTTSAIGMYETDVRQPSYEVLCKLAEYFDVSVDYLLGRSTSKPQNTVKGENNIYDLDPAYYRILKQAQEEGISADDLKLAIDFIKRSREKIKNINKDKK
jgi:transcriptional regulator with XRE-family HTH domain